MSAQVQTALRLVDPDTRVVLTMGLDIEPSVSRWEDFVADNIDDEALDWICMASVLMRGETWLGGGGASPEWSLQVAP